MSLEGHVLIAVPHLSDPNFRGSVVLIIEHSNEGTLGLILNRPMPLDVDRVTANLGIDWAAAHGPGRLGQGGPVQPEMVWLLHGAGEDVPGSERVLPGCWYTASMEGLEALAPMSAAPRRMYVGYAGWGAGQLEDELREGAWLSTPADAALVFDTSPDRMWDVVMRRMGIDPVALVPADGMVH